MIVGRKEKALGVYKKRSLMSINYAITQVNPPRLIRLREYRRGFQTPHGISPMPATLSRNGFLTTDTAQTQ